MIRSEGLLLNLQGPPVERFGIVDFALILKQHAEIVKSGRHQWVIGSQSGFPNPNRPFPKPLCFAAEAGDSLKLGQLVQGKAHLYMLRPESLLTDHNRTAEERFCLGVP